MKKLLVLTILLALVGCKYPSGRICTQEGTVVEFLGVDYRTTTFTVELDDKRLVIYSIDQGHLRIGDRVCTKDKMVYEEF